MDGGDLGYGDSIFVPGSNATLELAKGCCPKFWVSRLPKISSKFIPRLLCRSYFGPGDMMKPFEDATYALKVGEITPGIVSTDSGYHLIYRTG
jgi:hypothetical protein